MDINEKELLKNAASQLRALKQEAEEFRLLAEREKQASVIVTKLVDSENLSTPTQVLEKLAELRDKDLDELKVIDKALEYNPQSSSQPAHQEKIADGSLGHLSDSPSGDGMDNLTQFLMSEL